MLVPRGNFFRENIDSVDKGERTPLTHSAFWIVRNHIDFIRQRS